MNSVTVARPAVAWVIAVAAVCGGTAVPRPAAGGEESADAAGRFAAAEAGPQAAPVEPVAAEQLEASIGRGVAFLLASQRPDGSWGSADNTRGGVDIYAPPPGAHHAFRGAVTALCVSALVESGAARPEVSAAIDRGRAWLLEHLPDLRRATPDTLYNVWGHAYGIEALALLHRRAAGDPALAQRLEDCVAGQVELLDRYESVDGGWGYYDFRIGSRKPAASPTTFTTATVLLALADARDLGVAVPQRLFDRGLASIRRQTKPDRSYTYGEYLKYRPQHPVNLPGGSVGRSQACHAALRRLGDPALSDEAIRAWLERLVARNGWLDLGRKKPIPHESWFAVAGYFFFYGHYYAALCLESLPAADRPVIQDQLARIVMAIQEPDGCWWDYPFYDYHTQYGTAFAVRTLVRCRHGG
ncbi:MAG: hypothetical protein EBZ74_03280 [Planctomycetia bacterium]|nr:hypothetical protein [Planctomycetia bacterium]